MQENPFNALAGIIRKEAQSAASGKALGDFLGGELGSIISGMKLKLDRFPDAIEEYYVSEHLCTKRIYATEEALANKTGKHDHPQVAPQTGDHAHPHKHDIKTPWAQELRPLAVGDRVLVQAVNSGQNFVVVARLKTNVDIPKEGA